MSKEQIIRELENCYEYFWRIPYRREALRMAMELIKESMND